MSSRPIDTVSTSPRAASVWAGPVALIVVGVPAALSAALYLALGVEAAIGGGIGALVAGAAAAMLLGAQGRAAGGGLHETIAEHVRSTMIIPRVLIGRDGRAIWANDAFRRVFDVASDDPLKPIVERFGGGDVAGQFAQARAAAEAGREQTFEIVRDAGDGTIAVFAVRAIPVDALPGATAWSFRDLTERRRLERLVADERSALARREESFKRYIEDAPVGVVVVDMSGAIMETNTTFARMLGRTVDATTGQRLIDLVRDEDRPALEAKLARARGGEAEDTPASVRFAGDGRESSAAIYARRPDGDGPEGRGTILYVLDTTEQKRLEAQFAQSQKMQAVGQLAGGVAHDFNNLLTAMMGFCDLLLLRHRPGDPSFADIMQVKQNANRAANLVRQLLAFSRQQTLQPKVLDLTDVTAELAHLLRRLIGANIELQLVHERDLALVRADQGQIEQVVINLAVNARDAMPNGGKVVIRTANRTVSQPEQQRGVESMPLGDYVVIEVSDTGSGIPKEIVGRIFEPFFSTKAVGSGTGLGLSTVYGIVKQTGGFIFVDSTVGKGTTFTIYLPAWKGERPSSTAAAGPERRRDLTGAGTVLLVEDEDAVRLFSARALRNKGYKVVEANSGEAALELLNTVGDDVDVLVTDVVMPQMDGTQLIKLVRERRPDMKVVCISGYAEESFRKRLDSTAGVHFLPKPFTLDQLAGKVKEVIR
ncbi:MAG: response regulator [Alphaproteobacteria bacterium]|nr:response regulator [Alphaproteobacteria bacterium]